MSYINYKNISMYIRFDKRRERIYHKKDAPISFVWDKFIENCKMNYIPSEQLTVDEQLCTTKGRVPFKTYIPTKPGKYGIKIWVLADAKTAYLCNAEIYTGKQQDKPEKNQGERVVRFLADPFLKCGRTITTDNFFTSLNLALYLKTQKTALVGTVKKQRTFLPPKFQQKSKKIGTKFLFHKNISLCQHTEKPGKSVILLSS